MMIMTSSYGCFTVNKCTHLDDLMCPLDVLRRLIVRVASVLS